MSNASGDRAWLLSTSLDKRGGYAAGPKTPAQLKKPPASVIAPSAERPGSPPHQP